MKKIQKKKKIRKSNQAWNTVGPEYPGEGAANKLAAGSNSRYPDKVPDQLV